MDALNLPEYTLNMRTVEGKNQVFDPIRKKFVALTPEEWVRQNFLQYLIHDRQMPAGWCRIEAKLTLNTLTKRSDILVCNSLGEPRLVVECKAPSVPITESVMEQVVRYNWVLKAPFIVVTNGKRHIACHIHHTENSYTFLDKIPGKSDL